jgi:hypothetical protein
MSGTARVVAALLALAAFPGSAARAADGPGAAATKAGWKAEFDDVCARTQEAMTLSPAELKDLVARCDALKPIIDALDETSRKVYARRLETCRNLYQFVLDYKQKGDT